MEIFFIVYRHLASSFCFVSLFAFLLSIFEEEGAVVDFLASGKQAFLLRV